MLRPGDVVTVDFVGATGIKRRPAVVVSSVLYHTHRPDVVLGVLTTQVSAATTPTDHILQDWAVAGLHQPTAFRSYFGMAQHSAHSSSVISQILIGKVSTRACIVHLHYLPEPLRKVACSIQQFGARISQHISEMAIPAEAV